MEGIDFGRHSDDYAAFRPGFPVSSYNRLDRIRPIKGTLSLDLATGPGTVALELASLGSTVTGIDISREQVAAAARVATERGLEGQTRFLTGRAEETGLDANSFDLVTAGQCWHWFDSDVAMTEVRRVLRPGGLLVIAYYSYLAHHSPVARETEDLVLRFNPSWSMAGSTGIVPGRIDELIRNGFRLVEQFCYDHEEEFSHIRWRGRMRTCNGVGSGRLSPDEVVRFDDELARLLKKNHPEPMRVPHRVWCAVGALRRRA